MPKADTNKTTASDASTTDIGSTSAETGAGTGAQAAGAAPAQEYFVDGQSVSKEAYTTAAAKAGWDVGRMPENYFPAISTKNHGEK